MLGRLPQFKEGRLETSAQGYVGATPYVEWRDWPVIVLCLLLLAVPTLVARAKRSR